MNRSKEHPWLNRFAWLTAAATFLLLGLGGLVTSKGAGMAVPDWPTTYGYNMFLFPVHLWTGGIFYEHTHRLMASLVGLLTTVLAVWLWLSESRSWLRWLGLGAFLAVVLQGVLGGLRVTLYKDQIGIFHAALAQAFFVMVTGIALAVSGAGERLVARLRSNPFPSSVRWLIWGASVFIFGQLVIGATMRHQHAGLAVPDFPLAYGRLWPRMDSAFVDQVNRERTGIEDYKPITAFQIGLHMVHRIGAALVLSLVASAAFLSRRELGNAAPLSKLSLSWLVLILLQAILGAVTVWSNKAADIATAHVLVGALSLGWGTVLSAGAWRTRTAVTFPARSSLELEFDPAESLNHARSTAR
jgi:cytochrome c oxidase assembly protein subunit 15